MNTGFSLLFFSSLFGRHLNFIPRAFFGETLFYMEIKQCMSICICLRLLCNLEACRDRLELCLNEILLKNFNRMSKIYFVNMP